MLRKKATLLPTKNSNEKLEITKQVAENIRKKHAGIFSIANYVKIEMISAPISYLVILILICPSVIHI